MLRVIFALAFAFANILCFADYSDRGKPSDFEEHHYGPLFYIYIGAIVIFFVIIGGCLLYDFIKTHKDQIEEALGAIFVGLLVLGGALLIGKYAPVLQDIIKSKANKTDIESNVSSSSSSTSNPPTEQYEQSNQAPTLHYRTVEYYEECYNCRGSGRVVCPRCNGTGWYKRTCSLCNGTGGHNRTRCIYCNGKGYEEDLTFGTGRHSCFACNGTGYVESDCPRCGGSGYESEACDIFAADGQGTHMVRCSVCNGTGKIIRTRQESYYE